MMRPARLAAIFLCLMLLAGAAIGNTAERSAIEVRPALHGYRPPHDKYRIFVPAGPLAEWLGARVSDTAQSVSISDGKTTLTVDGTNGCRADGVLLVAVRPAAAAFGATVENQYPSSDGFMEDSPGILVRRDAQQVWIPVFPSSPFVMTARITRLDAVVAGQYGRDWLLHREQWFGSYVTVSVRPRTTTRPLHYLLRRDTGGWVVLGTGERGHEVSRRYVQRRVASSDPAQWREALDFLTSNPPPSARLVGDEPTKTLLAALESINELNITHDTPSRQTRRRQMLFFAWFVREYSPRGEARPLAFALYRQGRAAWALGDLPAAKKCFRQILHQYGAAVKEYGPHGPVTYHQALTRHHWVTMPRRTPVFHYDARETAPGPPVLLKQARVEPAHTLLIAYPDGELEYSDMDRDTRTFFRKYLKLGEGAFVMPKRNCISLADFVGRDGRE